jgi:serine/threonine-protein kinase
MVAYNIGDRVGDYEIIDVLGAGGMGKVYKVRNIISDRVEAMKVLLPNLASDADLAERFMREIKVQASLHHQNIAALHTALRVNNQLLMLIEFVEGCSIDSALRQGPIPMAKAVDYIKQVLLALAYAHSHGVVHRDIKPANMMLTPNGVVKLMDFGIAKPSADRKLTQTGRTVGSLYYMSPEQIQGAEDLGPRADLYSLGVSLYEMVTRTRPFQGDSDYSIMAAHLNSQPIPPVEVDPTLPPMLSDVILMAIAKDPDQRFQSADAFRKALESVEAQFRGGGSITKVVDGGARAAAAAAATTAPVRPGPSAPPPIANRQPQITPGSGKRGIYMAVGSIVTVAVLAIAALQGPKWFTRSEAASASPGSNVVTQAQIEASPVPQQQVQEQPSVTPNVTPQSQISTSAPERRVVAQNSPSMNQMSQVSAQAPVAAPPHQPAQIPSPVTQVSATQSSAAQAPTAQTPAAPAVDAGKVNALNEAREHLVMLGTRANAARASLTRMKEQQARQGLGMRGDISASEQRMSVYLDDAQDAIKAGDSERAKKALATAERELDRLDGFMGR